MRDGQEIAAAFGLGDVVAGPTYAARGELGRVFRLGTSRGAWAVKELLGPPEPDDGGDVPFQLAVLAAGVRIPRPVRTPAGDAIVTTEAGLRVRVYEWVDLDPSATPDPAEAGAALAAVHALGFPADGVHPWFCQPVGAERWEALLVAVSAAGVPWAGALRDAVPGLLAAESLIAAPSADVVQRCHLDFNADNVLVDTAGRLVVLDWENSGGGEAAQEVAQVLVELGPAAVDGYQGAGGRFEPTGPEVFGMTFAVQGHLVDLYARRALDDPDPENRSRSEARLATMLPSLLTVAGARRLLQHEIG